METQGACGQCKKDQLPPKGAVQIGDTVASVVTVGRGYDKTAYSLSQCAKCGSVWLTYVDSGAGGHGTFHVRLTRDYF